MLTLQRNIISKADNATNYLQMARTLLYPILILLLIACGGQTDQGNGPDSTYIDHPDSANIVGMAMVMERDLVKILKEDDIQSAASLCQEALDNIAYFHSTGDELSARIYTSHLAAFASKYSEYIDDMASQNYIIKQFVTVIYARNSASNAQTSDASTQESSSTAARHTAKRGRHNGATAARKANGTANSSKPACGAAEKRAAVPATMQKPALPTIAKTVLPSLRMPVLLSIIVLEDTMRKAGNDGKQLPPVLRIAPIPVGGKQR